VALFLVIAPMLFSATEVFAQETLDSSSTENNTSPASTYGTFPYQVSGATPYNVTGSGSQSMTPYSSNGGLMPLPAPSATSGNQAAGSNVKNDLQPNSPQQPIDSLSPYTTLVRQSAEQGIPVEQLVAPVQRADGFALPNQVYDGLHYFFGHDIIGDFFTNMGGMIAKFLWELLDGWMMPTIKWLTQVLSSFILNTNIAIGGLKGDHDDISPAIRHLADIMYSVAIDLLLLIFMLCIWKYWAEAQWRGMVNILSPVLRLISTSAILMCFPTLYGFVIQVSNEMVQAIWFNGTGDIQQLNNAIATSLSSSFVAGSAGLLQAFAPILFKTVAGKIGPQLVAGGFPFPEFVTGSMLITGKIVAFASLFIWTLLGGIIIAEIVCLIAMKAIQQILLIAQYMFAPIFIVFFALPDTESFTVKYMYGFVITNLWSFFWVGALRILVVMLNSDFTWWGKPILLIGVLTLMIMAPSFMMSGVIEPRTPFFDPGALMGFATGGMSLAGGILGNILNMGRPTEAADTTGINRQGGPAAGGGQQFNYAGATATPTGAAAGLNTGTGTGNPNTPPTRIQNGQPITGATAGTPTIPTQGATANLGGNALGPGGPQAPGLGPILNGPNGPIIPGGGGAAPPANPIQTQWSPHDDQTKLHSSRAGTGRTLLQNIAKNASFVWSNDGTWGIGRNAEGQIDRIYRPVGSSDAEANRFVMQAALGSDTTDEGNAATRKAAIKSGLAGPKTEAEFRDFLDCMDSGSDWRQTATGKARMAIAQGQVADRGARAFMQGKKGNAYSDYLRKQFRGNLDPQDVSNISSLIDDPSLATSPFNDMSPSVDDQLGKFGIYPSTSARACMMNRFVSSLGSADQRAVVPIMSQIVSQEVDSMPGSSGFTYEQRVRAVTQIANAKGKDFVEEILQYNKIAPDHTATSKGNAIRHTATINSGLHLMQQLMSPTVNAQTASSMLHAGIKVQGITLKDATATQLIRAHEIVERAQHAGLNTSQLIDPKQLDFYKNP
jgi:hypothetical protein